MKKVFLFCSLLLMVMNITSCSAHTQTAERDDILKTDDIEKIEQFLKTAHPDDPRRTVLKPKLVTLKNKAWTKGRENHKPMESRFKEKEEVNLPAVSSFDPNKEAEEFKKLMQEYTSDTKNKATQTLNQLFDNDPTSKETYIMVQNKSNCNMILRIRGKKEYNLPIPAKGQSSIVVEKGNYTFSGNLCGTPYSSSKDLKKSTMLVLNAPAKK